MRTKIPVITLAALAVLLPISTSVSAEDEVPDPNEALQCLNTTLLDIEWRQFQGFTFTETLRDANGCCVVKHYTIRWPDTSGQVEYVVNTVPIPLIDPIVCDP